MLFRSDPRRCALVTVLSGGCSADAALDEATATQTAVREAVDEVATETGAVVWDPAVALCPDGRCATDGPGFARYRDAGHISVPQARALAADLAALLRTAGA